MYYAVFAPEEGYTEAELKESLGFSSISDRFLIYAYPTAKERTARMALAATDAWLGVRIPSRTFARLIRWEPPYVDCNRRVWARERSCSYEVTMRLLEADKQERQALRAEFPGLVDNGPPLTDTELRMVWDRIAPELRVLRPSALEVEDLRLLVFVGRVIGRGELDTTILDSFLGIRPGDTRETLIAKIAEHVPDGARYVSSLAVRPKVEDTSPRTLFQGLSRNVVGQDEAKRLVSVAVFNHIQALNAKSDLVAAPKSHILLLGPSGVGKTLLAHSTGKILNLPFVSADATDFTPTGFVGGDADACIGELLVKAHGIVGDAERGVVLIDEVDKLAGGRDGGTAGRFSASTQSTLLRLIEGKDVKVSPTLLGDTKGVAPIPVSTARMLFFFGGAFPGLSEIVGKIGGYGGRRIGLRHDQAANTLAEAIKSHEVLASADYDTMVQALIEYGMGAELVGRIPTIAPLAPLTKDELRQCLLDVPHAEVKLKTVLFHEHGYDLEFDEVLIEKIVDTAYMRATGTRALQALVSRVISRASFDLLGAGLGLSQTKQGGINHGKVVLTLSTLAEPSDYLFTSNKHSARKTVPVGSSVPASA